VGKDWICALSIYCESVCDECFHGVDKRCNLCGIWMHHKKLCVLDNDARNQKVECAKY
jgi:hypothetical protein